MMVVQQAELSQDKLNCADRGAQSRRRGRGTSSFGQKDFRIAALIKPQKQFIWNILVAQSILESWEWLAVKGQI